MPAVSASAVRDKDGRVHVALVNVNPNQPATITARSRAEASQELRGAC